MGSIFKRAYTDRSAVWWIKYCANGLPIRESTGISTDTRGSATEAKRILKEREGRVALGTSVVLVEVSRVQAGIDQGRSSRSWRGPPPTARAKGRSVPATIGL